jgi:mRNA interferase RelE/StbE
MKYEVEINPSARKSLAKIPKKDRLRIEGVIELLQSNPYPPSSIKLTERSEYRVRVGNYRVIYDFVKGRLVILVLTIGHRKDVYRK